MSEYLQQGPDSFRGHHRPEVRFIERQAEGRQAAARLREAVATRICQHVVRDYAALLGAMASRIQTLLWE